MAWAINNLTAPDTYTPSSTLDNLSAVQSVNIDTQNQSIYWQVKQINTPSGLYTEGSWQEETYMLPGSRSIYRANVQGFRFRAAIPAAQLPAGQPQAQVTVEAVT